MRIEVFVVNFLTVTLYIFIISVLINYQNFISLKSQESSFTFDLT